MVQPVQVQTPQPVVQTAPPQPAAEQPPTTPASSDIPESQPKPSRKSLVVLTTLLILLAVAGTGSYFLFQKQEGAEPAAPSVQIPTFPSPTPQPQATHYLGSQTIALRDVSGGTSSGSATRSIIPGNVFHAVYATLPDPPEGQFYQAWAVGTENNFRGIGKLSKNFEGVYTTIRNSRFDSSTAYTFDEFFNTTIVTLESVDDEVMETKILEGTFTQ